MEQYAYRAAVLHSAMQQERPSHEWPFNFTELGYRSSLRRHCCVTVLTAAPSITTTGMPNRLNILPTRVFSHSRKTTEMDLEESN